MKYFEMLLVTGDNTAHALKLLKDKIDTEYAGKACKIGQLFLLPEAQVISQVATTPSGQPQMKVVVNLVCVIEEEPEIENLQRNYKPLFDYLNTHSSTFGNIALGWLAAVTGSIPQAAVENLQANAAVKQKPFNE